MQEEVYVRENQAVEKIYSTTISYLQNPSLAQNLISGNTSIFVFCNPARWEIIRDRLFNKFQNTSEIILKKPKIEMLLVVSNLNENIVMISRLNTANPFKIRGSSAIFAAIGEDFLQHNDPNDVTATVESLHNCLRSWALITNTNLQDLVMEF